MDDLTDLKSPKHIVRLHNCETITNYSIIVVVAVVVMTVVVIHVYKMFMPDTYSKVSGPLPAEGAIQVRLIE